MEANEKAFCQINLKSGEQIKLQTFKQGVPLTYQISKDGMRGLRDSLELWGEAEIVI